MKVLHHILSLEYVRTDFAVETYHFALIITDTNGSHSANHMVLLGVL